MWQIEIGNVWYNLHKTQKRKWPHETSAHREKDFKELIEEGYLYVDKTRYIYDLASLSTPYFFSRPRRFGKSLTISKLDYLFKGEKELFKDRWIYDRWYWKPHPVIRLSMNLLNTSDPELLQKNLLFHLDLIAKGYGVQIDMDDISTAFYHLIYLLYQKVLLQ